MSESSKLPRRERERLRHRAEILEAARKVMADRGLDGVTVEHVAREADFAVGSIYRHFASKEQLIDELLVDLAEPFFEELDQLGAQGLSFEQHLEAVIGLMHERQIETQPFLLALLAAPGAFPMPGSAAGRQLHEIGERSLAALDRLLEQGQREGVLPEGDRALQVIALSGAIHSLSKWTMFSGKPAQENASARLAQLFLNGARRGGRAS